MVKIRLQRAGAKKRPFYRLIAIDERRQRDGRALEFLGTYNPMTEPPQIRLERERIAFWRGRGAQLSAAAKGLLRRAPDEPQAPVAQAPAVPEMPPAAPPAAPEMPPAVAPAAPAEGEAS
jgi:small subunit ribosomal protein S16